MKPSKEQKKLEAELIYFLRLYNELKGRNQTYQIIREIEEKIDELVELIKLM